MHVKGAVPGRSARARKIPASLADQQEQNVQNHAPNFKVTLEFFPHLFLKQGEMKRSCYTSVVLHYFSKKLHPIKEIENNGRHQAITHPYPYSQGCL